MPNDETPNLSKREQFERERLTRRAALRKLGFGAGLSAFALLGVDDLARLVGRELEKRAGDNAIAGEVAKEFQKAGVAEAVAVAYCGDGFCTCQKTCNGLDGRSYSDCILNCDAQNHPPAVCACP